MSAYLSIVKVRHHVGARIVKKQDGGRWFIQQKASLNSGYEDQHFEGFLDLSAALKNVDAVLAPVPEDCRE